MLNVAPNTALHAHQTVCSRLAELSLPVWRVDASGNVLAAPDVGGDIGRLLRSTPITELVSDAARSLADVDKPQIITPVSGFSVIAVPERQRRRCVAWTIALAPSGEFMLGDRFQLACQSAGLPPEQAKQALAALATYTPETIRHLAAMIGWSVADLVGEADSRHAIAGFTRQLTEDFETIDLLHSLARLMGDPSRPQDFVNRALARLNDSMQFAWLGCWVASDPRLARLPMPRTFLTGGSPLPETELSAAADSLARGMTADSKPLIISEAPETGLPRGVQCIVQPVARSSRLLGLLIAGDKQSGDPGVTSFDIHLLETAGAFIAAVLENGALYAEQSAMFIGSLKALTSSLDAKDRYTAGHSERVACLARQLALALGLPENIAERVHIAGMVHDVGKIGVPEAVLLKPGKPTEAEFAMIKRHPEIGYAILKDIPLMQDILPGVLHHHERYDGKGYPSGLAGEQIPLFGRILAIADTFDAMSSNRSYRPALGRQQVIAELQRCAGTQLDPALVPVFLSLDLSFFDRLMAAHRDHVTDVAARAA